MNHSVSDSQSFLNLLNSQNPVVPSSDFPAFSSQTTNEPTPVQRHRWSPTEDLILISGWLNTSKDPIVSTNQKGGCFWKRVADYYNSSPQRGTFPTRPQNKCKQRWQKINEIVQKWAGCYETASKEQSSGQSENDVLQTAHAIFYNDQNTAFILEHAWNVLRYEQKWCTIKSPKVGANDKRKGKETAPEIVDEEVTQERPPGVKACKAAKRKKRGQEADLENLGIITRQKLLETLIAKGDAASELEIAMKNKMLTEMMSGLLPCLLLSVVVALCI